MTAELEQLVERAQDVMNTQGRLRGLLAANRAISSDLSLPVLLRRITQSACDLVGARYGALGVVGPDQQLQEFITRDLRDAVYRHLQSLPIGWFTRTKVIGRTSPGAGPGRRACASRSVGLA